MLSKDKKIAIVYGTRPELIKVAPLIRFLSTEKCELIVVSTGQHKDMLHQLEEMFSIKPDISFELMRENQSLNQLSAAVMVHFDQFLEENKPNLVIVQGDTSTVLAAAMSCYYRKVKVAHIEAGLRTFNLNHPFPEEFNRRVVSIFADYNFAPTENSVKNLLNENLNENSVHLVGNTVIDALRLLDDKLEAKGREGRKTILVTAHRRENHGEGIRSICRAVKEMLTIHENLDFVWPVHPNPNVKPIVFEELDGVENVFLMPPLDYISLISWIKSSYLIWTDSGGIQEECPSMKKPVLILRDTTERPEVIEAGFGVLTGAITENIIAASSRLLNSDTEYMKMVSGKNPFGDGYSSQKIAKIILND